MKIVVEQVGLIFSKVRSCSILEDNVHFIQIRMQLYSNCNSQLWIKDRAKYWKESHDVIQKKFRHINERKTLHKCFEGTTYEILKYIEVY